MARIVLAATACLMLAGCGGGIGSSALNPFNWFRSSESTSTEGLVPAAALTRTDRRPVVEEVTDLVVERVPGGAIVRARALAPVAGWHSADLVAEPAQSPAGVLAFTFRAAPPPVPVRTGGPAARGLVAATFVSDGALEGISQIRVISQRTVRTARR